MDFRVEKIGDVAIVSLPGDVLDASNTQEFKQNIEPILESNSRVVLDMTEMRFIDSSGCGALLSCLRKLKTRGGDLRLLHVSKIVRGAFKLIRLDQILGIHDSREDALKAFKA